MFLKRNKKYYISIESDDSVTPEETLLDSSSHYSDIEKPIPGSIFRFFMGTFVALVGIIFVFKLAVVDHNVFAELALQNKSVNFSLPPPRGAVLDRNGLALTKNTPVFNLLAITRELRENLAETHILSSNIAKIIKKNENDFVNFIEEQTRLSSTFFAHINLDKDQALAIEYLNPKGFYVVPVVKREYINGSKFSQVIGYTGKVSKDDLEDDYYFPTDTVGRLGIEAQYEKFLRGKHGNIFFSKEKSDYFMENPLPGSEVVLNLDYDLQVKFYDEIYEVLRESGLSRAAGIVQNPNNGEILALVSFPSFDNNIFSSEVSQDNYKKLFESRLKPLFNRVISGQYNPGSTIKPLIGMMTLEEKILDSKDTINDCVSLAVPNPYDSKNPYVFNNWRVEYGPFNLKRAIANSCNVYFFTVGGGHNRVKGLGAEKIGKYLKSSLADSTLGIDLPGEKSGFVPTPEWKKRERGEMWYLGDTYNISIGQGDLLATPIWLNSYISAVANGGNLYKPTIARQIISSKDNGKETILSIDPEVVSTLPFSPKSIDYVREAMRETVISGTAQLLKSLSVQTAAKTGTAEIIKGRTTNSLFTVFAPYEKPELSMTILIEGTASQHGLAIKVAYNVLRWYFNR